MDRPQLAKDIMVTKLVTLSPESHVFDGITRLLKNRVSGAPVVEARRRYVGVFSEKCCLRVLSTTARFINARTRGSALTAADVMSSNLITLSPNMDVFAAIGYLLKHKISGAPVLDAGGKLIGSFSERTSMSVLIQSAYAQMPTSRVGEFMETDENSRIAPDLDLHGITDIFLTTHFRRLQVIQDDKLVGQVSRRDALRAAHLLAKAVPGRDDRIRDSWREMQEEDVDQECATTEISAFVDRKARTISRDTDLLHIAQIFSDSGYRRLPVVESDGELVGQISRRDLLAATNNMMEVAPPREKNLLYLSSLVERQESPIE